MKHFRLMIVVALLTLPSAALAEPYWVAWEGNDYPENEGWERWYIHGGAERSVIDGFMRIDSTRDHLVYDQSFIEREIATDAGEQFVVEWSVRINESTGPLWDQAVGIATKTELLAFGFYRDAIVSFREGWRIAFQPDVFHTFRVVSSDLSSYSLFLDDKFEINGVFNKTTLGPSGVSFGDSSSGGLITSSADWDFVRFGVVPEPSSVICVLGGLMIMPLIRRK